jgi:hypothetical protein
MEKMEGELRRVHELYAICLICRHLGVFLMSYVHRQDLYDETLAKLEQREKDLSRRERDLREVHSRVTVLHDRLEDAQKTESVCCFRFFFQLSWLCLTCHANCQDLRAELRQAHEILLAGGTSLTPRSTPVSSGPTQLTPRTAVGIPPLKLGLLGVGGVGGPDSARESPRFDGSPRLAAKYRVRFSISREREREVECWIALMRLRRQQLHDQHEEMVTEHEKLKEAMRRCTIELEILRGRKRSTDEQTTLMARRLMPIATWC